MRGERCHEGGRLGPLGSAKQARVRGMSVGYAPWAGAWGLLYPAMCGRAVRSITAA